MHESVGESEKKYETSSRQPLQQFHTPYRIQNTLTTVGNKFSYLMKQA